MTGPLGSDFLRHILAELREQTDRGVVIIGGSYVENSLEHFLKEAWRKETDGANEKKALSEAFNPSGPLGSFKVKIQVAFLSRLIGRKAFTNLDNIKEIRNAFAHRIVWDRKATQHERLSFATQAIRDRCKNLWLLQPMLAGLKSAESEHGVPINNSDARSRYIVACAQWPLILQVCANCGNDPKNPWVKKLLS